MCELFLRESASFPDQRLESPVNNQSSFMEMFSSLMFGIPLKCFTQECTIYVWGLGLYFGVRTGISVSFILFISINMHLSIYNILVRMLEALVWINLAEEGRQTNCGHVCQDGSITSTGCSSIMQSGWSSEMWSANFTKIDFLSKNCLMQDQWP